MKNVPHTSLMNYLDLPESLTKGLPIYGLSNPTTKYSKTFRGVKTADLRPKMTSQEFRTLECEIPTLLIPETDVQPSDLKPYIDDEGFQVMPTLKLKR